MPDNLNANALNQYALRFTTTVLNEVYRTADVVNGGSLLKLTPVRQVNLGILNRLFEEWKSNAQSFRSPYFDFSNEEVQKALEDFMNTASQHIAVKRKDLEPLLTASVKESLTLLLSPTTYFEEKIRATSQTEFTLENAEHLVKYTHIHRNLAEAILGRLSDSGSDAVYQTQAISWLYELRDNRDLIDDTEQHIESFTEIFPINIKEIKTEEEPRPLVQKTEPKSFFDAAFTELDMPAQKPAPARAEPASAVISEIVAKANTGASVNANTVEENSLNNRFKVDLPKAAEVDNYGSMPMRVETIAGAIPLGQRFMFINQLFGKNNEHYEKAIYELDAAKSYEDAENMIWHRYASKHAWDVNGEAVKTLLSYVKRKFAK